MADNNNAFKKGLEQFQSLNNAEQKVICEIVNTGLDKVLKTPNHLLQSGGKGTVVTQLAPHVKDPHSL